nr:MAG TPA: hypothetical protein [Bacteriophage sp.]DAI57889.1 MAG TPA: hypothetical protein [Caudoviricetes sp.]
MLILYELILHMMKVLMQKLEFMIIDLIKTIIQLN